MKRTEFIDNLYRCVDQKSVAGLADLLAEDLCFRFASSAPLTGKQQVLAANEAFFASIDTMRHRIDNVWSQGDDIICNGEVSYTRLDRSSFSAPFATVLKVQAGRIIDYRIYADVSDL